MTKHSVTRLHIVSDLATPHNNSLVAALNALSDMRVVTWYAMRTYGELPWKAPLGGDGDNHYFDAWREKLRLLWRVFSRPEERVLLVGYSNWPARFILLGFWLLRRPFYFWTDHPVAERGGIAYRMRRRFAYFLLRTGAERVFVVGRHTAATFVRLGFRQTQLVNLPIFTELRPLATSLDSARESLRRRYLRGDGGLLFVVGSRLVRDKGIDLLVEAVARLERPLLDQIRLLVVGSGPEEESLRAQARRLGLGARVSFVPWLDPEEYLSLVAAADAAIHPARFDAFGGGTLFAMASGVPVIGSDGAGSAIERIEHGRNGMLYPKEDVDALKDCMAWMITHDRERREMGRRARETAEQWPPSRGARILQDVLHSGDVRE